MDEPAAPFSPTRHIFTVGELVAGVRELLEENVGRVWVVGEVSNLRRAGSGHFYFTLKDDQAQVRAALFRGTARRLPFDPEDGLELLVYGDVTVYEARGDLQILVRALEPRGMGALQLAFEQLRARLEAEGLFDAALKRELPAHPRRVGVVTSRSGAAIRDVIEVSGQRFPKIPLLIAPTRVQGEGAEHEIAAALGAIARQPDVDVILLVRGGGSLEDLLAFNTEIVARAIREVSVPVVSGVGHETDLTIADLTADARAPTPSAAAAMVFPDGGFVRERLRVVSRRLRLAIQQRLAELRGRLRHEGEALRAHAPRARLATQRARLEASSGALLRVMRSGMERRRGRHEAAQGRLHSLSPLAVLSRGYAIVRRSDDGIVVRRPRQVAGGDPLRIRLSEGEIEAAVTGSGKPRDTNEV